MTDDDAKTAIMAALTARPVTIDMVQGAADTVLADDPNRLNSFTKWLARNGEQFCALLNR